jgi:hypothetical protein
VLAFPTDRGLVVAVLYGTSSDWVRNVLAAGRVEVKRRRGLQEYGQPRLIGGEEGMRLVPAVVRRPFRLLGVHHFVSLTVSASDDSPAS